MKKTRSLKRPENFFNKELPIDIQNLKERIAELANLLFLIDETLTNIKTMTDSVLSDT